MLYLSFFKSNRFVYLCLWWLMGRRAPGWVIFYRSGVSRCCFRLIFAAKRHIYFRKHSWERWNCSLGHTTDSGALSFWYRLFTRKRVAFPCKMHLGHWRDSDGAPCYQWGTWLVDFVSLTAIILEFQLHVFGRTNTWVFPNSRMTYRGQPYSTTVRTALSHRYIHIFLNFDIPTYTSSFFF